MHESPRAATLPPLSTRIKNYPTEVVSRIAMLRVCKPLLSQFNGVEALVAALSSPCSSLCPGSEIQILYDVTSQTYSRNPDSVVSRSQREANFMAQSSRTLAPVLGLIVAPLIYMHYCRIIIIWRNQTPEGC